jgi:hypothetical protein
MYEFVKSPSDMLGFDKDERAGREWHAALRPCNHHRGSKQIASIYRTKQSSRYIAFQTHRFCNRKVHGIGIAPSLLVMWS